MKVAQRAIAGIALASGVAALLVSTPVIAQAGPGTCQLVSSVCTDPAPPATSSTKIIAGYPVTRTCWNYANVYNCTSPGGADCNPLLNSSCSQDTATCTSNAFNGVCLSQTSTYSCTAAPAIPTSYTNITQNPTTFQITANFLDTSPCNSFSSSASCTLLSTTCTDATPSKIINGLSVSESCWTWNYTYSCSTGTWTGNCTQYANDPNCTNTTNTCINYADPPANSICDARSRVFNCLTNPGATTATTNCTVQQCINGICVDASSPVDTNFGATIAQLEAQREGGGYHNQLCQTASTCVIFKGQASWCKTSLAGLFDCCAGTGGGGGGNPKTGFSNFALNQGASALQGWVWDKASYYVYDLISDWAIDAAQWAAEIGADTVSSIAWDLAITTTEWQAEAGVSFGYVLYAYITGATLATTGAVATLDDVVGAMQFNPWTVVIFIVISAIESWAECDQFDQVTDMRKDSNLCQQVGTFCYATVNLGLFSLCTQYHQAFCCYNSKLAKIVNINGYQQLGISWGTAQSPNCGGLTVTQIGQIDFSKINWSEFIADITASFGNVASIQSSIQQNATSYFGPSKPTNCPAGGC